MTTEERIVSIIFMSEVFRSPAGQESLPLRDRIMDSRLGRLAVGSMAILGFSVGMSVAEAKPAAADSGHEYTVTGTDGDGVWLHSDPGLGDVNDLITVMPEGTRFDAECFVHDTPIGEYDNPVWLHGTDGRGNRGWFTDAFSSTSWNWSNTLEDQGLPYCGTEQPAPEPQPEPEQERGGVVYYRPDSDNIPDGSEAELSPENSFTMVYENFEPQSWVKGDCSNEFANDFPTEFNGKLVTTLAGWSIGRLGPIYFLEQEHDTRRYNIDYIALFDPGDYDQYTAGCDLRDAYHGASQSETMARWMEMSDNNRLVIFAGEIAERDRHAGIQYGLFPEIKADDNIRDQVIVCNYDGMRHEEIYENFRDVVNQPKIVTEDDCPDDPRPGSNVLGWRP